MNPLFCVIYDLSRIFYSIKGSLESASLPLTTGIFELSVFWQQKSLVNIRNNFFNFSGLLGILLLIDFFDTKKRKKFWFSSEKVQRRKWFEFTTKIFLSFLLI